MAPQWKPEGLVAGEPQKKSIDLDFLRGPISRNFPKKILCAKISANFTPISPDFAGFARDAKSAGEIEAKFCAKFRVFAQINGAFGGKRKNQV